MLGSEKWSSKHKPSRVSKGQHIIRETHKSGTNIRQSKEIISTEVRRTADFREVWGGLLLERVWKELSRH